MVFIHDYSIRIRMDRDDTDGNSYDNTKIYIWRIEQEIGHTLYFLPKRNKYIHYSEEEQLL